MYCKKCGAELAENSNICIKCDGANLQNKEAAKSNEKILNKKIQIPTLIALIVIFAVGSRLLSGVVANVVGTIADVLIIVLIFALIKKYRENKASKQESVVEKKGSFGMNKTTETILSFLLLPVAIYIIILIVGFVVRISK